MTNRKNEEKQGLYLTKDAINLLKKDAEKTHIALEDKETHTTKLFSDEDLDRRDFYVNDNTKQKLEELLSGEFAEQHSEVSGD